MMPLTFTPNQIETEAIGADLSQVVDRIIRQYSDFPTAFQKEAIQNSWDERKDRNEGKEWLFRIYSIEAEGKRHLIIEDSGTKGMNDERWEAFLSLWKPKKSLSDAGGQGQGKFVLMGASNIHTLIVESSSNEIPYRCKLLKDGEKSRDNFQITNFVAGIQPLEHRGTKIWVFDVKEDFFRIVKSEEFKKSIIESWWQIIDPRFNANIELFDLPVSLTELPKPVEENILLKDQKLDNFGIIKKLVLQFYEKPIPEIFQGIRIQRANMMITKLDFEIYDREYQGRFSGYIEFDGGSENSLEKQLKNIEKTDHCGFLSESPWNEIKKLIKGEAEKFVSKIIPPKEGKTINIKNLSQIIQRANQIINDYLPEIVGEGPVVPPIEPKEKLPLRIDSLYINKREVKFGDTVQAMCKLVNDNAGDKKISLYVELKRSGIKISEEEYRFKIIANGQKSIKLSKLELNEALFEKGKYILRVTIQENRHDIDTKSTSFYLEIKREPTKKGFIKRIDPWGYEGPTRYINTEPGVIKINLSHKDFANIYDSFQNKPNIRNKQIEFYIIKICLDHAVNEIFKLRFKNDQTPDIEDLIKEINDIKDRMYYEIYS